MAFRLWLASGSVTTKGQHAAAGVASYARPPRFRRSECDRARDSLSACHHRPGTKISSRYTASTSAGIDRHQGHEWTWRTCGVHEIDMRCLAYGCVHDAILNLDGYPAELPVKSFEKRMHCASCDGRNVEVQPAWR